MDTTTVSKVPLSIGNLRFTASGAIVSEAVEGISVIPARNIGHVAMIGKTITVSDMRRQKLLTMDIPQAEVAEKIMLEFFARGL